MSTLDIARKHSARARGAHHRLPTPEFYAHRFENRVRRQASGRKLSEMSFEEWFLTEWVPVGGAATYVDLTLDTTAPAGVTISINSGAQYTIAQAVTAAIGTSDGDTTGYQMKIWGNVDTGANPSIQATEGASSWITFSTSQAVTLSSGDGTKTLNVKVRDDVWNESSSASDTITLDTSAPVPNVVVAVSPAKISKVATKDTATFGWQVDVAFEEYKVKRVANASDAHNTGTQIPTAGGSTNVAGSAGGYPATTTITTTIKGVDLESAGAEGANVVKVFVRDAAGNWSV